MAEIVFLNWHGRGRLLAFARPSSGTVRERDGSVAGPRNRMTGDPGLPAIRIRKVCLSFCSDPRTRERRPGSPPDLHIVC
jgi:hypothetical protein